MGKLYTKEKTKAQQERDEQRDKDIVEFGMGFKDYEGNTWFIPTEGGGYSINPKCKSTTEQFYNSFRAYISK